MRLQRWLPLLRRSRRGEWQRGEEGDAGDFGGVGLEQRQASEVLKTSEVLADI